LKRKNLGNIVILQMMLIKRNLPQIKIKNIFKDIHIKEIGMLKLVQLKEL
jgi:hypothetical protein